MSIKNAHNKMFYLSGDGKLMAVEVKIGSTFEVGIPKVLFDLSSAFATFHRGVDVLPRALCWLSTAG